MAKQVFIPAVGGAQQGAIAAALAGEGWSVRGSSRTARTVAGVDVRVADLETGAGLAEAMEGCGMVVFTLPQDHRPGRMVAVAETVVRSARAAGVGRIVFSTAGSVDEASDAPLFRDMRAARAAVTGSGLEWVVLRPTVYLDNLLAPWSAEGLRTGVLSYPAPAEAAVSWLSHRSLGAWAAAVVRAGVHGRDIPIGGPQALDGAGLADAFAKGLGRPVAYRRIPLDAFAAGMDAAFGAPAGARLASLYAAVEADPGLLRADPAEAERLGVRLESAEDFARSRLGAEVAG